MRLRTRVLLAALIPIVSGCATVRATFDGWATGADGLSRSQRQLRDALASGDFPVALAWEEDDALLRALTAGASRYYASQFVGSAALLDTAVLLADERMTTSVSRSSLALVTNDMARPYLPRRTERLFIPYYAMLSWAQLGQWEDAAVEARRMVALLARFSEDRDEGERSLHASMHYLAGAVFERAGEREAAAVAYRNAHSLVGTYPERPAARGAGQGDVMIVVERGFVAHRATESIRITLGDEDREGLRGDDDARRRVVDRIGQRMGWASNLSGIPGFRQTTSNAVADVGPGPVSSRRPAVADDDGDDDDDDVRHISLAFPSLRRSPHPWAGAPRLVEDSTPVAAGALDFQLSASVDDASAVDERRERASLVTRELVRAAAKYAVTKAAYDKGGEVAGKIADVGSFLLDRADVRSWHLLPQEIVLLRARMPEGQHRLRIEVGDGANLRQVDLGPVTVKPGRMVLLPARLWREPAPALSVHCGRHARHCDR
jgi:hypothetical protein